jgi:hypothetical protein
VEYCAAEADIGAITNKSGFVLHCGCHHITDKGLLCASAGKNSDVSVTEGNGHICPACSFRPQQTAVVSPYRRNSGSLFPHAVLCYNI